MSEVTQQQVDNLIAFIASTEDTGSVTNQIVARVLDYLNTHTQDAEDAISLLASAIETLQGRIADKADLSATYTRGVIDSLLSGKVSNRDFILLSRKVDINGEGLDELASQYGILRGSLIALQSAVGALAEVYLTEAEYNELVEAGTVNADTKYYIYES